MTDKMIGSSLEYPQAKGLGYKRYGQLLGTGAGMPSQVVSNQDLIERFNLIATDRAIQFSIGIKERRNVEKGWPSSRYLHQAVEQCLANANLPPEKLDRIIYARLTGDHAIPATSLRVLERLGVRTGIPVMDISVACSGFLHGTELALSCIDSGDDHVLVLGGDRSSINKEANVTIDSRTVFLNGDGFVAALYGRSSAPKFVAKYFYTDSSIGDYAYIPFGTELMKDPMASSENAFTLAMPNGAHIHQSIIDSAQIIAGRLLDISGLHWQDIDFFITSDQTALAWKAQLDALGIPEHQSCSCFYKYGNTVAAMVPLNLHEAISTGKLRKGMRVMMMGHGAGASGGGFVFTY